MVNLKKQQQPDVHEAIDNLQLAMMEMPQADCPVIHLFTPGIYIREILMRAGTVVVSKVHNTIHPYVVSTGELAVYNSEKDEGIIIKAPYTDITYPGTRRILHIFEDVIWTTFHPLPFITGEENNWTDEEKEMLVAKIENIIIEKRNLTLDTNNTEVISNE